MTRDDEGMTRDGWDGLGSLGMTGMTTDDYG